MYDHSSGKPVLVGVEVLHAGPRQRFTPRLIEKGVSEGWLKFRDGMVVVEGVNCSLRYRVVREPGYYCCHCGAQLQSTNEAREHVKTHSRQVVVNPSWFERVFLGARPETVYETPAADPDNPSGYRRDNFYECVLEG